MKTDRFTTFALARTAKKAFRVAQDEARYWHGHRPNTGTIADKPGYVLAGQVNSRHVDRLEEYFFKATHRQLTKIPKSIKPMIKEHAEVYADADGPAVCFEVTGTRKKEIKEAKDRAGTWDKVYVFLGRTS